MTELMVLFTTISLQFDLPQGLLSSLCFIESSHRLEVIHYNDGHGHSIGVCQIKHKTAKFMGFKGTEQELLKPEVNIYYAAKYLNYQIKRYKNLNKGLIAYNRGNAKDLTTTKYSAKVIQHWRQQHGSNSIQTRFTKN